MCACTGLLFVAASTKGSPRDVCGEYIVENTSWKIYRAPGEVGEVITSENELILCTLERARAVCFFVCKQSSVVDTMYSAEMRVRLLNAACRSA